MGTTVSLGGSGLGPGEPRQARDPRSQGNSAAGISVQGLPARPRCQWVPRGAWTGVRQRRWGRGDTQTQTGSRAPSSAQSHCPGPVTAGRQERAPSPAHWPKPLPHQVQALSGTPPSSALPPQPSSSAGSPPPGAAGGRALSLSVCWSHPPPPRDTSHPLPCLPGGNPRSTPHPPPPPLLAAPTPPAGAGQPSLTRAPHRVPRGPLAHSTLEVAGKRLCSLSASIHSRVPTMARGAERAGCRQIGSLAERIWGGGSQVELPAASRAPPRPSRTPACSPVPHLLTAAPPAFSLCCRGACTIAPPTPGPWTGLSSPLWRAGFPPLWRAGFPPLALGMLCSRHQGTS